MAGMLAIAAAGGWLAGSPAAPRPPASRLVSDSTLSLHPRVLAPAPCCLHRCSHPFASSLAPPLPARGVAAPGQPAPDLMAPRDLFRVTPGPPGPLLTAEEVTAAVGRPVRATGFQAGILGGVYRGEELTVSITVAKGALGGLSSGPARRWACRRPASGTRPG